jgi:hypothetical protein
VWPLARRPLCCLAAPNQQPRRYLVPECPFAPGLFRQLRAYPPPGLDASVTQQFGPFGLRLAYSFLEAEYDADGELFTGARNVHIQKGTRLAGLPRHSGKLSLDWTVHPRIDLGIDLQAASSLVTQGNEDGLVEDPEPDEEPERADWRIRGHVLASLRASYRPAPGWNCSRASATCSTAATKPMVRSRPTCSPTGAS